MILWPGGDLVVDADVFAVAAQRALRSGSVEDYGAALKLYAGELLPEDRYADWAAPHRERLAALHEALTAGQARARLAAVKAHYDPVNRFLFNQNIRPAQAG